MIIASAACCICGINSSSCSCADDRKVLSVMRQKGKSQSGGYMKTKNVKFSETDITHPQVR